MISTRAMLLVLAVLFTTAIVSAQTGPARERAVVVVLETEKGAIEIQVDSAHAPVTAANFLKYVDGKFHDGGIVNRAVRRDNTIRHDVEIEVIQFQIDPARQREQLPPIALERTSVTGLKHVDGAVSMARTGPDSATASFFITIGDQPELDFGGKRNADGQGFAVFGRVVAGMDVVKAIHASPTGKTGPYATETLDPPIKILKAYRKSPQPASNGSPRAGEPLVSDYAKYTVGPLPDSLPYDRSFYKKYVDAHGIPVISSDRVPDAALLVARDIVVYMLAGRPDLRKEMIARGYRVGIMAETEMTTDIPEQRDRRKPAKDDPRLTRGERDNYDKPGGIGGMTDKQYWDRRARGLGGVYTTGAEENVLGYPGTRYYGEHILVHEWSHGIMSAIRTADPALYGQIQAAYKAAIAAGKYKGHYAETNASEYWAEGTQWWFWSNYEWFDGSVRLQTPDDLKAYDPQLFDLLTKVYISHHIPADVYHGRNIRPARRAGG